jgi:hypothetical protein
MTRKYSSISVETTLASGLSTTATTMVVASGTAASLVRESLAAGDVDQFTVAIDPDTVNEEIVFVTNVSSDTLKIVRGQAGTGTPGVSGITHSGGAKVKHVLTSDDLNYFTAGINASATIVGTQTLTNKTLTAPIISTISNTGTLTLPTSTDTLVGRATTDTLTNKTLTSPIISAISNTGTLTLPTSTDTLVGRATADTLTNKTLTTPTINQAKAYIGYSAKTADYTVASGDEGYLLSMNNAAAQQFSIPTDATFNFAIGTVINFVWIIGAGRPTIAAATPGTTTISSTAYATNYPQLRAVNSSASAIKLSANNWLVVGDII